MKLSDYFSRHRKIPRELQDALQSWFVSAFKILDMVIGFASGEIEKKVKNWNLDNPDLLYILGYIAGFLDAAYQRFPVQIEYDERYVEVLYLIAIERYLMNIDGTNEYLEMTRSVSPRGGSDIGGMQLYPEFMEAMKDGGNCYIDTINGRTATRFSLFLKLSGHKIDPE